MIIMVMTMSGLFLAFSTSAADRQGGIKVRWVLQNDEYYAYNARTGKLLRNQRLGRYYTKKDGSRVTNAFRKGEYYNWKGKRTDFKGGFIKVKGQIYYFYRYRKLKGFHKIGKYYYFFDRTGAAVTGIAQLKGKWRYFRSNGRLYRLSRWKTIGGNKYFLSRRGVIREGFFTKNGKTYYQTAASGICKGLCQIDGLRYCFDDQGALNDELTARARRKDFPDTPGQYSDLTFFTRYESGTAGYGQTGGDKGRAYGRYQFDYRYSLVSFLKYCVSQNSETCAEFAPFTAMKPGDRRLIAKRLLNLYIDKEKDSDDTIKMLSESPDLEEAWNTVYNRDPSAFASWQDQFALVQYYIPVEKALVARGIHLNTRTYVERGAVFSYSIQEGQSAAVSAVTGAGITDATGSRDFLNLLYDYRWNDSNGWGRRQVFSFRYSHEKADALAILTALGG